MITCPTRYDRSQFDYIRICDALVNALVRRPHALSRAIQGGRRTKLPTSLPERGCCLGNGGIEVATFAKLSRNAWRILTFVYRTSYKLPRLHVILCFQKNSIQFHKPSFFFTFFLILRPILLFDNNLTIFLNTCSWSLRLILSHWKLEFLIKNCSSDMRFVTTNVCNLVTLVWHVMALFSAWLIVLIKRTATLE